MNNSFDMIFNNQLNYYNSHLLFSYFFFISFFFPSCLSILGKANGCIPCILFGLIVRNSNPSLPAVARETRPHKYGPAGNDQAVITAKITQSRLNSDFVSDRPCSILLRSRVEAGLYYCYERLSQVRLGAKSGRYKPCSDSLFTCQIGCDVDLALLSINTMKDA